MKTTHLLTPAALLLVVLAACSKDNTVNMNEGAADAAPSQLDKLPDCTTDAPASPRIHGPDMIRVGRTDGVCFWIDETEVSRADYDAFLATQPVPSTEAPCDGNDFEPDENCEADATYTDAPDHPAVCLDWCDAQAFCEWAGKTLCDAKYASPKDAKSNSWYSACSLGGQTAYAYSDDYDDDLCNGAESETGTTVPVTGKDSCQTDDGVRNMSGNVAEWVNECDDTKDGSDSCRIRGGSYKSRAAALMCETVAATVRSKKQVDIGFRCCAYE